jgi:predicted nuclease of predicted toxin-antitoxin system
MPVLIDLSISYRLCRRLDDLFPNSQQTRLAGLERADDPTIWTYAQANKLTLVTLDADFADIAALRGAPPKVIWLRCGNQPVRTVEQLIRSSFAQIKLFAADEDTACLELY